MSTRVFHFIFLLVFLFIILFIYMVKENTKTTINFFPIDDELYFKDAYTKLTLDSDKNKQPDKVSWISISRSSSAISLRQDVSLVFINGKLTGVKSKWRENTDSINLKEYIHFNKGGLYQALSYHHGEAHYGENKIRSVQQMSYDELSIDLNQNIKNNNKKQLLLYWNNLLNHFNINVEEYMVIPFIDLYHYNENNLPSLSKSQTDKIIGQLWEGFYKNYIIPVTNSDNSKTENLMPLILFDNNNRHLLVLFELNGEKELLVQQYSN